MPTHWGFPGGTVVKNLPANLGDARGKGSIPGLERSPEGGNGNPLQYSCLKYPMDRGAAKSWTQLSTHPHPHIPPFLSLHSYTQSLPLFLS